MGYPRESAIQACQAAFFNLERAVEYLCTGIPEGVSANQENTEFQLIGNMVSILKHFRNKSIYFRYREERLRRMFSPSEEMPIMLLRDSLPCNSPSKTVRRSLEYKFALYFLMLNLKFSWWLWASRKKWQPKRTSPAIGTASCLLKVIVIDHL